MAVPSPGAIFGAVASGGTSTGPSSPGAIFGVGAAPVQAAPVKSGGHGGILGGIGHVLGQTASDLEHAAINAPAGFVQLAEAVAHDTYKGFRHPLTVDQSPHTLPLVKASAQSFKESAQHPLRHPGITLLNALPVVGGGVSAVLRGSAAAAAASEGAGALGVLKAAAARPNLGERTLRTGNLEVHPEPSRSALGQVVQHGSDKLLQNAADKNPAGRAATLLNRKVGKTVTAEAKQATRNAKGPANQLLAIGRKLTPGEQKALQLVAEQAPVGERITAASARVTGARDAATRAHHQEELTLLHEAKPHLAADATGKPIFAPTETKLPHVYKLMAKVAGDRETLLKNLGLLSDEAIQSRTTNAGRVALGAKQTEFFSPAADTLKVGQAVRVAGQKTLGRVAEIHPSGEATVFYPRFSRSVRVPASSLETPGRITTSTVETQRTVGEAQARLGQLEKEHAKAVDTIAAGLYGPAHRSDVNFRTQKNVKAKKAHERGQAATQRRGWGSTSSGAPRVSTVVEQRRAAAEQTVEDAIAKNPNHPTLQRWRQRTNEIDRLRAALNPDIGEQVNPAHLGTNSETVVSRSEKRSGIVGAEHFTATPEAVRIPDVATKQGTKTLNQAGRVGAQGSVGHLKAPGSTTHEYGGTLREHSIRRQDTAQLVAESGLEAAKYAGLKHVHDLVRQAAVATPSRADDIAVRLGDLKAGEKMPLEVRKFLGDPEEFFKNATPAESASMLDKARQQLFIQPHLLTADAKAEFEKLNAAGKVGWVPKRILGEIGNPAAPLRAVAPGKAVGSVDAINNASRFAILYLKPAYAIPNVLGNTALSIIQQGWAAPRNLAQAAGLVQKLGHDDYARIDASMGEGVARAVSSHGAGRLSGVVDFAAGKWSTVVDTPFRRASFIHEARQSGFKTPEQLHELLMRDAHDPQLIRVGLRANRDAIDYENLTPTEREIIRRVVFFYPWVKGSTVYAGRFLREHPVKAAATGQLGQQGQQFSQGAFGQIPSYLEGLIPGGVGRAINPNSAAILQTPAQVGEAIQGLATGNIPEAAQALQFVTPAVSLALAAATRRDSGGYPYKPGHRDILHIAEDQLVGQLPQVSLYHELQAAISGKGGSKLYPPSVSGALGKFFVGGLYPRKINKLRLNELAASEQTKMRTGR